MNNTYLDYIIYLIFPVMTLSGAMGAYFFKKGAVKLDGLLSLFTNWNIYLGGTLYVIAALLNIVALKFLDYSIVVPLTSMTYIWSMIITKIMLKEKITKNKIIGMIIIILGLVLIALES